MHGIREINKLNAIQERNHAWLEQSYQPKSVFGPTGRPPVAEKPQEYLPTEEYDSAN